MSRREDTPSRIFSQKMRESLGKLGPMAVGELMTVQFEEHNGVLVFEVPARVDVSNTAQLVTPIQQQIAAGYRQLVLDLGETKAIDSTALGALVQIFKQLKAKGGSMVLVGVGDAVRRVFSLTRLDTVFVQSATRDEALRLLETKK